MRCRADTVTTAHEALAGLLAALPRCDRVHGNGPNAGKPCGQPITWWDEDEREYMCCANQGRYSQGHLVPGPLAGAVEAAEAALAVPAQVVTLTKAIRADGSVVFQCTADRRTARLVEQLAEALGAKVVRRG